MTQTDTRRETDVPDIKDVICFFHDDDIKSMIRTLKAAAELNLGVRLYNRWSESGGGVLEGEEWILELYPHATVIEQREP